MRLKKANAVIGLIVTLLFLIHSQYQTITYALFYYNPVLTKVFALSLAGFFYIHIILSVFIVFRRNDTVKIDYPELNRSTILQRDLGLAMVILYLGHLFAFQILQKTSGTGWFYASLVLQVLFFGAAFTHIAVSFSKALVTLGLVQDMRRVKIINRVMAIICAVLWAVTSFVIVFTYIKMFTGAEG